MPTAAEIVRSFLTAVEDRDPDAVVAHFSADATWQNVPHPPAVGRDGIHTMLAGILGRSEAVRWDVVSESYEPGRAWLERVDRFWIDGVEYAVQCNGVLEIDEDAGVITQLRDYVDLGEWRARLAAAQL